MQAWKYTLPAFLVPFAFVLDPQGIGLLLKVPGGGTWTDVLLIAAKTAIGLAALAAVAQGWALRRTTPVERALLVVAGLAAFLCSAAGGADRDRDRPPSATPRHLAWPSRPPSC